MSKNSGIFSLNIANSSRDEATEDRLGLRLSSIIAFLKLHRSGMQILTMQEIRRCKSIDGETFIEPWEIVNMISQELGLVCAVSQANNPTETSFWKAIFYDSNLLFHVNSHTVWTGETEDRPSGPQSSTNLLFSTFQMKGTDNYFTVCNVHAPVAKEGRDIYFAKMISYVQTHFPNECVIMIGDHNTIPDLGGLDHIAKLESVFVRASSNLGTTFKGFSHDINPVTGLPYESQLDQVFLWNIPDISRVTVCAIEGMVDGHRISDHFLITSQITF